MEGRGGGISTLTGGSSGGVANRVSRNLKLGRRRRAIYIQSDQPNLIGSAAKSRPSIPHTHDDKRRKKNKGKKKKKKNRLLLRISPVLTARLIRIFSPSSGGLVVR